MLRSWCQTTTPVAIYTREIIGDRREGVPSRAGRRAVGIVRWQQDFPQSDPAATVTRLKIAVQSGTLPRTTPTTSAYRTAAGARPCSPSGQAAPLASDAASSLQRLAAGGRRPRWLSNARAAATAVCAQLAGELKMIDGIAHQARVRFSRRGRSHDRRTPPRRRTVLCMTTARTARGTASSMPNGCVGVYIRAVGSTARTPPASRACPVSRSHTPVRALPCATTGQLRWIRHQLSGHWDLHVRRGSRERPRWMSAAQRGVVAIDGAAQPRPRGWTSFHFPSAGGR